MDHRARVAVAVHDEIVDDEIAQHRVHVQNVLQVLIRRELPEARDQPLFVLAGHIGLRVVENIRVAFRIVVNILQLHVARAAHPAKAATLYFRAFPVSLRRIRFCGGFRASGCSAIFRGGFCAVCRIRLLRRRSVRIVRHLEVSRRAARKIAGREISLLGRFKSVRVKLKVLHVEVPTVAAPAAEGHRVRLIELARLFAVVPLQKRILPTLDR